MASKYFQDCANFCKGFGDKKKLVAKCLTTLVTNKMVTKGVTTKIGVPLSLLAKNYTC